MLRVLMVLGLLAGSSISQADSLYMEPSQEQLRLQREAAALVIEKIDDGVPHAHSVTTEPLAQGLNDHALPRLQGQKGLFESVEQAALSDSSLPHRDDLKSIAPLIMVSQSMPENRLKSLLTQAKVYEAMVVIRGLPEGDLMQQMTRLRLLAEGSGTGLAIDPTLFTRFQVGSVPTFVLPMTPILPCTESGCVTPQHVKAAGDVTLRYFLEMIDRLGDVDEQQAAQWQLRKVKQAW